MSITYSECVFVALVIQHAMRMRHIVIYGLSGCTTFFHIISYDTVFGKKGYWTSNTVCLIFSTNFFWDIYHFKKNWARYDLNVYWSSCKVPVMLSDFNLTWIFSTDFQKILRYKISWHSFQWEPSFSMWRDGWTYMTKLIVAFRNFAIVLKNQSANAVWEIMVVCSQIHTKYKMLFWG